MEKILNVFVCQLHKVVFVVTITAGISLYALGDDDAKATDPASLAQILQSMFSDEKVQNIFKTPPPTLTQSPEQAHDTYVAQQRKRMDFYKDYIAAYYPKALVISDQLFLTMTPDAIEDALKKIVNVLAYNVWEYFVDKEQKNSFKVTHYWEYVVDQMSLIHDFLFRAYVNTESQMVFIPDDQSDLFFDFAFLQKSSQADALRRKSKPLLSYLTGRGKTVMFDFYALIFDYYIKLFNEGILLQDLGQASMYLAEMDLVVQKLQGSTFEQEYGETLKTAHDLLTLLKQRLGLECDDVPGDGSMRWKGDKTVASGGW